MKQSKVIFKDYREILSTKNLTYEECDIHQFNFINGHQNSLHYLLLSLGISVIIYDTHNDDTINPFTGRKDPLYGTVFITLRKDDESITKIIELSQQLGGEYCGIVKQV